MSISTVPDQSKPSRPSGKNQAMFSELDRHKHWSFWRIFGWLFILVIIVAIAGVTTLVAATGIVTIPGVSNMVYATPPTPARTVQPAMFDLGTTLKTVTASKNGSVSLVLSEQQLTSLVSAAHMSAFRQAQISIDSNGLSFFGYYIDVPFGNPVILQVGLNPTLEKANTVSCSVSKLSVGNINVPVWAASSLGDLACNQISSSLQQSNMMLSGLSMSNQAVTLTYEPTPTSTIPSITLP